MNPMARNKHTHTSKKLERSDEKETRISKWRYYNIKYGSQGRPGRKSGIWPKTWGDKEVKNSKEATGAGTEGLKGDVVESKNRER